LNCSQSAPIIEPIANEVTPAPHVEVAKVPTFVPPTPAFRPPSI